MAAPEPWPARPPPLGAGEEAAPSDRPLACCRKEVVDPPPRAVAYSPAGAREDAAPRGPERRRRRGCAGALVVPWWRSTEWTKSERGREETATEWREREWKGENED